MNDIDKPNLKLFATVPHGDAIKGMAVYKDKLIVATTDTVYICSEKGIFTPIMFEVKDNE